VALLAVRAELLAQWVEQFRPQGEFHAIVIADGERWVAALPLVSCRVGKLIPAGGLPTNPWSACGDLLLDPTADVPAVMEALLTAIGTLSWPLLWLDDAALGSPRWKALLDACEQADVATCCHERFQSGRVVIRGTWEDYRNRLPKNHRQGMQRALRRLAAAGSVHFEMQSRLAVDEVKPWLQEVFSLEDLGWKGEAGSSVLRTPDMFSFFVRQAEQLAAWGFLETATLRLDGRLLAFVYGYRAKDVYFAHKISYDPEFSAYSPGQLLFYHILERLHEEATVQSLDFMGPMNQSLSRWRPEMYSIGRMVFSARRGIGRAMMYAYQHGWRNLRDPIGDGRASFGEAAALERFHGWSSAVWGGMVN
jgi:hypothetical protein